jgi:4-amino-4-deoxy-L-arabinose transferase-like glycosyltransferase
MHSVLRFLNRDHAWSAAFFSVIFTVWVVYTDEVINSDGIRYVEAARLFIEQGWSAGFNHFHWPFYTLLIAGLSKLLFIELETAAYVLNTMLLGLLAFMFVRCARELGGDKRVTLAAAILLLTHVTLNEFRDLIVRDFGYLAFSFTGVYFLLKHKNYGTHRHALGAGAAMVVATLFRVEGIVFLIFAPLVLLWQSTPLRERFRSCLLVWLPAIILAVIVAVIGGIMFDGSGVVADKMSDSVRFLNDALFSVTQGISDKAHILEETVLNLQSRNMGTESVIAIMLAIMLSDTLSATGFLTPALVIWGLSKERIRHSIRDWSIPAWLITLNIIILIGFVVGQFFLVSRYALYFSLLVSLLAAFPLAELLHINTSLTDPGRLKIARRVRIILIIMLVYMLGDGLTSLAGDKAYIHEAAQWLDANAKQDRILSNEEHMYYYTDRLMPRETILDIFDATRQSKIPAVDLRKYDYLVLKVGRKQKGFEERLKAWVGKEPTYI